LFITKLQEINSIYGQQQLENIKNTINLIREFKILNIQYNLLNNNYNSFLKYLSIFNKNSQHNDTTLDTSNDTTLDTTNDTTIDTTNDTTIDTTLEIYSDYYSIIENNNNLIDPLVIIKNPSQSEEFDLSSTNISNEIVSKYFNKLNVLVNINIQKSINWCKKHQFAINKEFILKY
jgi:hypothetical protein